MSCIPIDVNDGNVSLCSQVETLPCRYSVLHFDSLFETLLSDTVDLVEKPDTCTIYSESQLAVFIAYNLPL